MRPDTLSINTCPTPANSGHVLIFDSTRRLLETCATAAAAQAPGSYRSSWAGVRWNGNFTPVGQAVTCVLEILTNPAGTTSAAWSTDTNAQNGGSFSVAADTTQPISWLPSANDSRIRILAGGTAPTSIRASFLGTWDRTSGA